MAICQTYISTKNFRILAIIGNHYPSMSIIRTLYSNSEKNHTCLLLPQALSLEDDMHRRPWWRSDLHPPYWTLIKILNELQCIGSHSSAPSIVTSMIGYWSTSPKRKPPLTMSSFDWKPTRHCDHELQKIIVLKADGPVGINTRSSFTALPCAIIRSTTYGTVEPKLHKPASYITFGADQPDPMPIT